MDLLGTLFADLGSRLADLGVRRGRGRSLSVPGERGDAILIGAQSVPSGVPGRVEFLVNVSQHLLPWTAYQCDESLAAARARRPEHAHGVHRARLTSPANGYLPELWTVTPDTLATVGDQLGAELRRALTVTWLPVLPRAELRALLRDPERRGPSIPPDRRIVDLMCRIEDLGPADLDDLVRYFRSRGDDDPDLGRLARWIEQTR